MTAGQTPTYPQNRTCPYHPPPGYRELRNRGALQRVTLYDGREAWLVATHAEARRLLADPRVSSNRQNPNYPAISPRLGAARAARQAFIGMDRPQHGVYRRMTIPEFTVRRINELRPRIEQVTETFLDELLAAGPPADLVHHYALPIPSLVICELLGVPYADHNFFQDAGRRMIRSATAQQTAEARGELARYLGELVTARRREPGPGMISRLANEELERGELDFEDLVMTSLMLLVAGHETTANMIALGTYTLLEHPEQLAALRSGPGNVASAVEELLRYLSIADIAGMRVATDDIEIAGVRIRAGDGIILPLSMANRDPDVFDDPETFDIRRPGRNHLAFGYGIHQCLGQNLARLELEIALPRLFERIPTLRLAVPGREVRARPGDTIQGVDELPVTWSG